MQAVLESVVAECSLFARSRRGVNAAVTERVTVVLLSLLLAPFALAADKDDLAGGLYRYKNSDGVLVIDYSIPAQYADQGYDIISASGRVLKHVPSKDERVFMSDDQQQAIEAQKKEDAYILASYSSLADVELARQRKLETIDREIDILKANLMDAVRRESDLKDKAAAYQASGQQPPKNIIDVINELADQQQNITKLIDERRQEKAATSDRYDSHGERLKQLRPGVVKEPKKQAAD